MFVISQLSKSTNSLRAFNSPWRGKVPPAKRCKNPRDIPHSGDWGGGEYLVVIAAVRNPWDVLHSGDWGGGYLIVVAAVMNPWDVLHSGDWGGGGYLVVVAAVLNPWDILPSGDWGWYSIVDAAILNPTEVSIYPGVSSPVFSLRISHTSMHPLFLA